MQQTEVWYSSLIFPLMLLLLSTVIGEGNQGWKQFKRYGRGVKLYWPQCAAACLVRYKSQFL